MTRRRVLVDRAEFKAQDHPGPWRLSLQHGGVAGLDLALVIENPDTNLSYVIELGISDVGELRGQLTADEGGEGPDALVLFRLGPDQCHVADNFGHGELVAHKFGAKPPERAYLPDHGDQPGFV
jgi:hypothetical protein